MKKIFLLISFFLVPSALFACGWSPNYNQFSLFFHPVGKNDKLYPFKFVADEVFYNYNTQTYYYHKQYDNDDYAWNNQEWKTYLKTAATLKEINDFVFKYPFALLENLYYHIEADRKLDLPDSMQRNALTNYFKNSKNYEVLGYLMYAKQCELELNKRQSLDQWDYITYTNKIADKHTYGLIKNGVQLFNAAKSDWIKKRYAFQFIRLAHYFKDYKQADALYSKYVQPMAASNGLADFWLWGLRGGMLRRLNRPEKAAIWFAKTVVRSPDKYLQAYNDFTHIGYRAEQVLPFCESAMDSLDVLFVSNLGSGRASVDAIEKMYALQPNSSLITFLLSRELAKLEQSFLPTKVLTPSFKDWSANQYQTKSIITPTDGLDKLLALCKKMYVDNNKQEKHFLGNMIAYLSIATGELVNAKQYLLFDDSRETNPEDRIQSQLLDWTIALKQSKKIDENSLLSFLKKIDQVESSRQSVQSAKYHFLQYFVAPYFEKTNQPLKKAYALLKANYDESASWGDDGGAERVNHNIINTRNELSHFLAYNITFDDLENILQLEINKQTADDFIKYASNNFANGFGKQALVNIIFRKHIRNTNWSKALAYYKMGEPEENKYPNPLVFRTKEETGTTYYSNKEFQENTFSTETILVIAKELKSIIKKRKGEDLFNYGMLLYHFSYYGRLENLAVLDHRNFGVPSYTGIMDRLSFEGNYYPIPNNWGMKETPELVNYFHLNAAADYFQKAYQVLKNNEQKAQCVFMQALCWQKTADANMRGLETDYVKNSLRNPYFNLLKRNYSQSTTYSQAYGTCSYLRMFVGK